MDNVVAGTNVYRRHPACINHNDVIDWRAIDCRNIVSATLKKLEPSVLVSIQRFARLLEDVESQSNSTILFSAGAENTLS